MKQVLSFLLSLVLMVGISTSAFAAGNTYNDVSTSHWAYQHIESVPAKGLFGGVGGRFAFCRPAAGVCDRRAVPRMLDRRNQVGRRDRLFVIGDAGRIGHQADGRLGDAGGFPQRLFNVGLAGGAAHAGHVQLNLRHNHFLSIKRVVILFPSPLGKGFLWLYYSRLQSFCQ